MSKKNTAVWIAAFQRKIDCVFFQLFFCQQLAFIVRGGLRPATADCCLNFIKIYYHDTVKNDADALLFTKKQQGVKNYSIKIAGLVQNMLI